MNGMQILNAAYALAFAICSIAASATPYYRIFPVWTVFAAATALQAINVEMGNIADIAWAQTWWAPAEVGVMAGAAMAVGEAIWLRTSCLDPVRRFWLRFGVATMPLCTVVYLAHWQHGTAYSEFLAVREWFWLWLALAAVTATLFFCWYAVRCPRAVRHHCAILTWLLIAHSIAAPQLHMRWAYWRLAYRIVAVLCCAAWVRNCASVRRVAGLPTRGASSLGNPPAPARFDPPRPRSSLSGFPARTTGRG